jgi:hypothetical protein
VDGERGGRLRTFLIGGLVGSLAGAAATGRVGARSARRRRPSPGGLAAFEQAPCFREAVEREAAEAAPDDSATLG